MTQNELTIPDYGTIGKATEHDWWHYSFNAWRGNRKIMAESNWKKPMIWQRKAAKAGELHLVFCGSAMDVFDHSYELVEPRTRLFDIIEQTPNLLWQLTTKSPENALAMLWLYKGGWQFIPRNIQIVVTLEGSGDYNDRRLHVDEITEHLPVQLSIEPCFWFASEVREFFQQANLDNITRIIVGGESGANAEPSDIDAFRAWRDGCEAYSIPFFFKQHGKHVWASQDPVFGDIAEVMGDHLLKSKSPSSKFPLDGVYHHAHPTIHY